MKFNFEYSILYFTDVSKGFQHIFEAFQVMLWFIYDWSLVLVLMPNTSLL